MQRHTWKLGNICVPAEANPTKSWKQSKRKVIISKVLGESAIQMTALGGGKIELKNA